MVIRLITVGNQKSAPMSAEDTPKGLDSLVESVCESYHIPASVVPEMKTGLENALYEFLSKFISDNNIKMNESTGVVIPVDDILENIQSATDSILESARVNGIVSLTCKGEHILSVMNISESITYQLGNIDVDKLDSDSLLEAWKCTELEQVRPLLTSALNQLSGKE